MRRAGSASVTRSREGAVTDYLLRMRRVNGSPVWVEVTARARPAGAAAAAVEALVRDVSERKRLDDQSKDIYQQILQSEKMAALGQTISGVAHELNNPLATILSWAERLSEKPLDDTSKRGGSVILSEAERAARSSEPADVRAEAAVDARDDRHQLRGHGHARAARYEQMPSLTVVDELAPDVPRSSPMATRSSRCCSTC
jgi:signal transduction histidine kinase